MDLAFIAVCFNFVIQYGGPCSDCNSLCKLHFQLDTCTILIFIVGQFIVSFRTDEESNMFPGFQMYVICYRPDERDLPGMHAIFLYPHDNHYHSY